MHSPDLPLLSLGCPASFLLSCPLQFNAVLSCLVLSCFYLSCPLFSCPVMYCHVTSCPVSLYSVLSCSPMSSHFLSCHILSCPDLSYPSCPVQPYPDVASSNLYTLFSLQSVLSFSVRSSAQDLCSRFSRLSVMRVN